MLDDITVALLHLMRADLLQQSVSASSFTAMTRSLLMRMQVADVARCFVAGFVQPAPPAAAGTGARPT